MIHKICNHEGPMLPMKPKTLNLQWRISTRRFGVLFLLSLFGTGLTIARADSVSELASFSVFEKLKNAPDNASVRSFVAATQKLSSDLQISKDEAKKFSAGAAGGGGGAIPVPVAAFWADVLTARTKTFASGGMAAQPPYDHAG